MYWILLCLTGSVLCHGGEVKVNWLCFMAWLFSSVVKYLLDGIIRVVFAYLWVL